MAATRRDAYVRDLTPAERSAAYVLELWFLDGPTRRYLAARFTSRAALYAAYVDSLRVPRALQATVRYWGDEPSLAIIRRTDNPIMREHEDAVWHRNQVAVLRGSHAGSIVDAGPRVFNRVARQYLMESFVHGEPGWYGIAGWRGKPIDLGEPGKTPVRHRDLLQDGDTPLWTRLDDYLTERNLQ